jgi:hypothetical protein
MHQAPEGQIPYVIVVIEFQSNSSTDLFVFSRVCSFKVRDDDEWWILPIVLFLVKALQAGLVNWHVANLEIQDYSLFSPDSDRFWAM